MNSPSKSVGVAAVRILSRIIDRPRAAKSRRFRPLAESMEARAVLSHVALAPAIAIGHSPSAIVDGPQPCPDAGRAPSGPRSMDAVEVNGQVELQPGD